MFEFLAKISFIFLYQSNFIFIENKFSYWAFKHKRNERWNKGKTLRKSAYSWDSWFKERDKNIKIHLIALNNWVLFISFYRLGACFVSQLFVYCDFKQWQRMHLNFSVGISRNSNFFSRFIYRLNALKNFHLQFKLTKKLSFFIGKLVTKLWSYLGLC